MRSVPAHRTEPSCTGRCTAAAAANPALANSPRPGDFRLSAGAARRPAAGFGDYHISADLGTAANYFLPLGLGNHRGRVLAPAACPHAIPLQRLLAGGYFAGALALLLLPCGAARQFWYQAPHCC